VKIIRRRKEYRKIHPLQQPDRQRRVGGITLFFDSHFVLSIRLFGHQERISGNVARSLKGSVVEIGTALYPSAIKATRLGYNQANCALRGNE
jgi:hypothetical protein